MLRRYLFCTSPKSKKRIRFFAFLLVYLLFVFIGPCAQRFFSPPSEQRRAGEPHVPDTQFIACVQQLLEAGAASTEKKIAAVPLLVVPVTLDYTDLKTFFCNLSVPVERIFLINTGRQPSLKRVLEQLDRRVKSPEQLYVAHHPENLGYAAAVNLGFRLALKLGPKKVPFVFVSNTDVRFFGSVLEDLINETVARTHNDAKRLAELQSEVSEAEARSGQTRSAIRVWDGHYDTGTVVTSRWLPARIRRMQKDEVGKAFQDHYALFFPQSEVVMCSFFVTHLALATVGLLDENFYPAYGEDIDYLFRIAALGFQLYTSQPHRSVHYGNGNLLKVPLYYPSVWRQETTPQLLRFNRMNYEYMRTAYRKQKWFPNSRVFDDDRKNHSTFPFNGKIPIDAWVKDVKRVRAIRLIGEGALCAKDYIDYNYSLLIDVI